MQTRDYNRGMSETTPRPHGRAAGALRPIAIELDPLKFAEGSALIEVGDTRVLVAATLEKRVPPFLIDSGRGWITGEYAMLPRATSTRNLREVKKGRQDGRSAEIQRLIGRSLRAAIDMKKLGERSILIDCDVIQADGGTRTAAITGAYVALVDAVGTLERGRSTAGSPIHGQVAAVSVGIYQGQPVLDLDYAEDSEAETDLNVVMNDNGAFIELQGTAEGHAFRRDELDAMLTLAGGGVATLLELQRDALEG